MSTLQPRRGRWLRADYLRYSVELLPGKGVWWIYDWVEKTVRYTPDRGQDARRVLRWLT